jgi:homocysteine S-methyltransferase
MSAHWATLAAGRPLLLDGGLATELERRGHSIDDALWSARLLLDDPDAVRAVHADYLRAGADVVSTASYQASRQGLATRGLDAAAADAVLARSVALARQARDEVGRDALVAGSLGPYGALLADGSEYRGDYPLSVGELIAIHRPRVEALLAGGADLILFETLPSLAEARAVAALARALPEARFWAQVTAADAARLASGDPLAELGAIFADVDNVLGLGINCCAPAVVEAALPALPARGRSAAPNRGERWDAAARRFVAEGEPFDLGAWARRFLAAGATLIGGCCRTTPADIAAARRALDGRGG